MQPGEFSRHTRSGPWVVKRLSPHHPAGSRLVAAASALGAEGMRRYVADLRSAGVQLPDDVAVTDTDPLTVRHRWVEGPSLLDVVSTDPDAYLEAFTRIAGWVQAMNGVDARVDANVENFRIRDGEPVLVDVLPPLVPSAREVPQNLFDELFDALCYDTTVALDAFIGYALRKARRRPGGPEAVAATVETARRLISRGDPPAFPAAWFSTRARLAVAMAAGECEPRVADEFFALTSVLTFRGLDEVDRARHRDRVHEIITNLGPG